MNTEFTPEQEFQILLLVPNFRNKLLGVEFLINRFNLESKYNKFINLILIVSIKSFILLNIINIKYYL